VLAWVVLIATAVLGTGGLIAAIAGIVLIATVFAAVYHAEVVAHRTGQPFGTLVLALAVTVIETALIVLSAPAESAGLPRYRLRGRHGIIIAALVLLPEGLAARAADDPRQHARQRRALARRVVLAVPSPRDHERRSLAPATRFFTADATGKFRHRVAKGISRGRFQDRGAVFHCQHGPGFTRAREPAMGASARIALLLPLCSSSHRDFPLVAPQATLQPGLMQIRRAFLSSAPSRRVPG
jgi:hypothetical protein